VKLGQPRIQTPNLSYTEQVLKCDHLDDRVVAVYCIFLVGRRRDGRISIHKTKKIFNMSFNYADIFKTKA